MADENEVPETGAEGEVEHEDIDSVDTGEDEGDEPEIGDDDDQGEDDGDDDLGDGGTEEPVPRGGRASRAVQRAKEEAATARAEAAAARAQLADRERRIQEIETRNSRVVQQEEEQRLALMEPEQRLEYKLAKQSEHFANQVNQIRRESQLAADKSSFDAMVEVNPVYAKHAKAVETEHARMLALNPNLPVPRLVLLKIAIGEAALVKGPAQAKRQQARGAARVNAARGRPTSARSDATSGGSKGKSLEDKLDGVFI